VRFEIELEAPEAGAGDTVAGVARADEDERSRRVFARLYFMETVPGAGIHRVAEGEPQALHEGDLRAGQELRFSLELPEGALRTYHGEKSRLGWYVEVVSDEPGFDSRGDAEVLVGPEARCARQAAELGPAMSVSSAS
jgi:hypothetical protein